MRWCPALLVLVACTEPLPGEPGGDGGEASSASWEWPGDGLTFEETTAAVGLVGVQGAVARRGGPPLDLSGAADGCDEATTKALGDALSEDSVILSGPIFDLGYEDGAPGRVYRPVQLLALREDGRCVSLAALSDEQSMAFQNGFGSIVRGSLFEPAGMMMHLVEAGEELWVFANTSERWFSIDPSTGIVIEGTPFERTVAGAISDGAGGAMVSLSGVVPVQGSTADPIPPQVILLGPNGDQFSGAFDLPIDPELVGFGHFTEDRTGLIPGFVSNDLTLGPDGRLWVLHSPDSALVAVDVETGDSEHFTLPFLYPTGIAAQDGHLVVTAGLEADRHAGEVYQKPSLWTVDTEDGSAERVLALSRPVGGWSLDTGFVNLTGSNDSRGVYLDRWLGLTPISTGQLVVTDPGNQRILLID